MEVKKNLEVHHDKETMAEIIDKFKSDSLTKEQIVESIVKYHIENNVSGITLCKECHRKTETYGGRNRIRNKSESKRCMHPGG